MAEDRKPTIPDTGASSRLRVLQLTAPGRFGGLETVVRQLATGLADRGHEVRVVCRLARDEEPASHPLVSALEAADVAVDVIQLSPRAFRQERAALSALIRVVDPDVVHTHGSHMDVVGARAARLTGVPRVATAHGFTGGSWKNRFYELLQRRSFRSAQAVIAVSRSLADRLERDAAVAPAVHCVNNAWTRRSDRLPRDRARRALGLELDGFVVGWVGRLDHDKGPDIVVEALRHPSAAKLVLCMVGDGPLAAELRRSIDPGGGAAVEQRNGVPDAGRLFAAFDVFVLSSRTEGTPMVLFEAMDAVVPIVATRVGGVPDVVDSAEALLVDSEDPSALREAVLSVAGRPGAARHRAERAKARLAAVFGPGAWLDAHEALYRRVMAGASGRAEPR
jgi:glycosyltransferase involved in cell wall biosynthesis